jgi:peptidoglycan/LPS O-acetylase OafA/YrhL
MQYFRQFDGLRFVAVALVLLHHFAPPVGESFAAGYYGVELFFVLSGFLITRILYNSKGSIGSIYKKFMGRRALRIFPIYYLLLFILLVAGEAAVSRYLLPLFTYTFNYTIAANKLSGIPLIHLWSLCVEEQFYLVWPFVILWLRPNFRNLIITLSVIVLVCWAQMVFQVLPIGPLFNNYGLFPRAYALALGGITALLCQRYTHPPAWTRWMLLDIVALIALAVSLVIKNPAMYVIAPSVTAFFLAKIYYQQLRLPAMNSVLQQNWTVYLGRISYGIYLYHIPVAVYFSKYVFAPVTWPAIRSWNILPVAQLQAAEGVLKFFLFSLLSIAVAHLSYQFIEQKLLSLKDKWFA